MTESTKSKIFEELLKYPDEIIPLAFLYARNFVMYGTDVTEKWQTAVAQAAALEQAYCQGIADEIKRKLMIKPQPAQQCEYWDSESNYCALHRPSAQPEIVRCKDCKHRPSGTGVDHNIEFPDRVCPCQCEDFWYSWMPGDDWFCKNGERSDNG